MLLIAAIVLVVSSAIFSWWGVAQATARMEGAAEMMVNEIQQIKERKISMLEYSYVAEVNGRQKTIKIVTSISEVADKPNPEESMWTLQQQRIERAETTWPPA